MEEGDSDKEGSDGVSIEELERGARNSQLWCLSPKVKEGQWTEMVKTGRFLDKTVIQIWRLGSGPLLTCTTPAIKRKYEAEQSVVWPAVRLSPFLGGPPYPILSTEQLVTPTVDEKSWLSTVSV